MKSYFELARTTLQTLCKEYGFPEPELVSVKFLRDNLSAAYDGISKRIFITETALSSQTETILCVRHEFAHYFEGCCLLKYSERRARHFEKNKVPLRLPNGQMILPDFERVSE